MCGQLCLGKLGCVAGWGLLPRNQAGRGGLSREKAAWGAGRPGFQCLLCHKSAEGLRQVTTCSRLCISFLKKEDMGVEQDSSTFARQAAQTTSVFFSTLGRAEQLGAHVISDPCLAALWAKGSVLGTCVTACSLLARKAWPAPKPWVHTRLLPCRVVWRHSHCHTPTFGCMLPHHHLCVEQWWGGEVSPGVLVALL